MRHDFEICDTGLIKAACFTIQASIMFSTVTEYQLRNTVLYIRYMYNIMVYNLQCNLNKYKNLENRKQNQRGWGKIVVCNNFFFLLTTDFFYQIACYKMVLNWKVYCRNLSASFFNQRTNGPVNAHLRSVVRIYQ